MQYVLCSRCLACLVRFNNRLHTIAIIIMHYPAWSFRPTLVYEYPIRTKQMEEEGRGCGDDRRPYLQLPEYLWLAAGLKVLQGLGPEAVFLVQGAMATRGADESMTMQEPEHESSPVVSRPVPLTKAAWEMQFFCGCVLESPFGKSLTLRVYFKFSHLWRLKCWGVG